MCSFYVDKNHRNVISWEMKREEDNTLIEQSHSRCKHTYKQRPLTIHQGTEFFQSPNNLGIKSGTFNMSYILLITKFVQSKTYLKIVNTVKIIVTNLSKMGL